MSRHVIGLLSVPVLAVGSLGTPAGAALVGNNLIPRQAATDGATTVLQVYRSPSDVIPGPGVIKSFSTFNQGGGGNFNGYILRPTGNANEYNVVFDSGMRPVGGGAGFVGVPNTFQHTPVAVQAGDLIAHYRTGVPFDDQNQPTSEDPQPIYFSSPDAPVQGQNITLGSAAFPENTNFIRTYSFAADYRPAGDPSIGNDLSIRRFFGSDGATNVLNVYHNSPVPSAGSLDTVSVRFQTTGEPSSAGQSFQFLVLRPAAGGGSQYDVVYNSGSIVQPVGGVDGTIQTYALPDQNGGDAGSVTVAAGDLVAHYGAGIPFTIVGASELGAGTDNIYFPSPAVPSGTITLGEAGTFPLLSQERDYALSANFIPIPEPAALSLLALGGVALLARRRRAGR